MKDVLVYGGGMLGCQVAYLLQEYLASDYRLVGFIDDVREPGSQVYSDLVVVGSLEDVSKSRQYEPTNVLLAFAIGYSEMVARGCAFQRAKAMQYRFLTLVHPKAHVERTAQLGEGVTVLAGTVVDQFVTIDDGCYVHIGCKLGERCRIGSNNYFSAGSTLGGSVVVGCDNFFGINVTVVNDLEIGSRNFMNAGSLVYREVTNDTRIVEYREQRAVAMPRRSTFDQ